jgi:hypothetical protein
MVSSFLIIGFKLSKETVAISALLVGIILQIIYRKMKKDENFSQEENIKLPEFAS